MPTLSLESRALERLRDAFLVAVLVTSAAAHFAALRGYHFEDAFITFRYAANLAAGEGFVFNPGERIFGTSTPLYALLLGLLGALGADPSVAGELIFCLALAAAGGVGALVLRREGLPNAGVFFALGAAWALGGVLRFHGMETTLYLALLLGLVGSGFADRPWTIGVLAGLLCLTRYDGVVPVGVVLLYLAWRRHTRDGERSWRRRPEIADLPWREALVSGSILGAWLLFAFLYFGDPMPHTLGAKAGTIDPGTYAARTAVGQLRDFPSPLDRRARVGETRRLAPMIALGVVALVGAPGLLRRRPRWWVPPAITALLLLGYSLIGPPLGHRWYHVPGTYCAFLFATASIGGLLSIDRLGRRVPSRWATITSLAALAASLAAIPASVDREARFLDRGAAQRLHTYDRFADWILRHDLDDARLLTREPGYLAYRTGVFALDAVGLVTADVYYHGAKERRSDWPQLLRRFEPDLVVIHSEDGHPAPILARSWLPVMTGPPERLLLLSRALVEARADDLVATWLAGDWLSPSVETTDEILAGHGIPWTRPFRLDADEIQLEAIRQGESGDREGAVQLVVDGVPVLQIDAAAFGPEPIRRALPTYPWRGRVAELCQVGRGPGWRVRFGSIHVRDFPAVERFDDFEAGFGERWARTFSPEPTPTVELVASLGLPAVLGRSTASSLGRSGVQTLESRPFRIEHDRLAFVFGDHGGPRVTLSLWIDGERTLQVAGRESGRLDFVKWDLVPYRGREAVLVVEDGDPSPEKGVTIDEIVLFSNSTGDGE